MDILVEFIKGLFNGLGFQIGDGCSESGCGCCACGCLTALVIGIVIVCVVWFGFSA